MEEFLSSNQRRSVQRNVNSSQIHGETERMTVKDRENNHLRVNSTTDRALPSVTLRGTKTPGKSGSPSTECKASDNKDGNIRGRIDAEVQDKIPRS